MTAITTPATATLADRLLPARWGRVTWVRSATLVLAFALLTALFAQIKITLGFTPVPITGQTFAVLLSGTALGVRRGAASQLLYWVLGLVGLPFYAGSKHGWKIATGSTFGYFIGFIAAAALVGALAERRQDRTLLTSLPAMLAGTVVIYVFGAAWLAHKLNIPVATGEKNAIAFGITPFLIGDAIKVVLAGGLTPLAWRFAGPE